MGRKKYGAGKETRTLDLYLGKVSLYQLSYSRKKEAVKFNLLSGEKPERQNHYIPNTLLHAENHRAEL
jgi:hypothetical protein